MSDDKPTCAYCRGARYVDGQHGVLACRMCLGTGRAPYEGNLGHDAPVRELRRITELQRWHDASVPIIAALAIYGEAVNVAALVTKAQALNEA